MSSQRGTRFIPAVNAIIVLEGARIASFLALLHSPREGTGCAHGLTRLELDGCWWIRGDLQAHLCLCGCEGAASCLWVQRGARARGAAPRVHGAQAHLGIAVAEENGEWERGSHGAGVLEKERVPLHLQTWPQSLAGSCKRPRFFHIQKRLRNFVFPPHTFFFFPVFFCSWTNVCS